MITGTPRDGVEHAGRIALAALPVALHTLGRAFTLLLGALAIALALLFRTLAVPLALLLGPLACALLHLRGPLARALTLTLGRALRRSRRGGRQQHRGGDQ